MLGRVGHFGISFVLGVRSEIEGREIPDGSVPNLDRLVGVPAAVLTEGVGLLQTETAVGSEFVRAEFVGNFHACTIG